MSAFAKPCPDGAEIRALLALREGDELPPEGTARLAAHLAECAACRDAALDADPTLLFLPLAAPRDLPADEAAGRRVVEETLAAVALLRSRRRFELRPGPRRLRIAAALLAGVGLTGLWASRERAGAPPESKPVAATRLPGRPAPPAVEKVESPGAVVYQFASSTPGEPTVVFVVDRNADL